MRRVYCRKGKRFRWAFMVGLIFIICCGILGEISLSSVAFAYTKAAYPKHLASVTCSNPATPTSQSLLVVLLDRSGSLHATVGPTDPHDYSTSVTKALADLWLGQMAVIPFNGDTTSLPVFGPVPLSDPAQRADLKNKVEQYRIGGGTPLSTAMHEALGVLKGAPAGSRVVLITDGAPDGHPPGIDGRTQEQDIRTNLISQFCDAGIPVSAFGLTITDPDAAQLLTDITQRTGATYRNVTSPEDLANAVISLYAQWLGLTFTRVSKQNGNFPVSIDTFAQQVSIISFRSDSNYSITLVGPDGKPLTNGVEKSTPPDRHYEIDSLAVSGPIIPGVYIVNVSGDPDAQVYVLISSTLQVHLIAPTAKTVAYDNESVQIQAEFLNGGPFTPGKNEATILANVTLLVNGQSTGPPSLIELTQEKTSSGQPGPIFSGATIIYNQPGELLIELEGNYKQAIRQTSFTLPLLKPIPPKPFDLASWLKMYSQQIIFGLIGLLFLVVVVLVTLAVIRQRHNRPKPYGYLTNGKHNGDVELERFRNPIISSRELEIQGNFRFGDAKFELIFDKEGTVKIRTATGNVPKVALDVPGQPKPVEVAEKPVEIKAGRKIYINGNRVASFETLVGRRW